MRAMVFYSHGDLSELVFETDFPDPKVGANDVMVAVRAVALNHLDVFTRRGMPGIKVPLPMITGGDVAGEIVALGSEVTGWSLGDRVVIDPVNLVEFSVLGESIHGGLCDFVKVPEHQLIKLPSNVSFEDAASLPIAYGTAYRMMVTRGHVNKSDLVLVLGASGGVGVASVQLAKMAGAKVIACASNTEKLEKLKELGADDVINYANEDIVEGAHRICGKPRMSGEGGATMIINFTGGDTWQKCIKCLRLDGRMLTCGATAGFDAQTDLRYVWTFEQNLIGSNGWSRDDLHELLRLVSSGQIDPVIDRVVPLEDTVEAVRMIEDREIFGKIIVKP